MQVQARAECVKIPSSMRVPITQARVAPKPLLTPRSPGSDLNLVITTDFCSAQVKCTEAALKYKFGRHSAL